MWTLAQVFSPSWSTELWEHIPILIARSVIAFVTVLVVVRWTGKRSIANLAPFDLAMVIMIGEVAAIPVSDLKVDLLHGILPVVLIGTLHVITTTISLHSKTFEDLTEGQPTLLVKDGKVLRQNLLKERVSMADLKTALRHKEISSVDAVKEAWIEHAGGISVLRKEEADAARPVDVEHALDDMMEAMVNRIVAANAQFMRAELRALLREGQGGGRG